MRKTSLISGASIAELEWLARKLSPSETRASHDQPNFLTTLPTNKQINIKGEAAEKMAERKRKNAKRDSQENETDTRKGERSWKEKIRIRVRNTSWRKHSYTRHVNRKVPKFSLKHDVLNEWCRTLPNFV